ILSHTAGFGNWDIFSEEPRPLKFKPGAAYFYSGEGYIYLQRVMEYLTGLSLDEIMIKHVFLPFKMQRSSFVWKSEYQSEFAMGYGKRNEDLGKYWLEPYAAFSLYTTATDLAQF